LRDYGAGEGEGKDCQDGTRKRSVGKRSGRCSVHCGDEWGMEGDSRTGTGEGQEAAPEVRGGDSGEDTTAIEGRKPPISPHEKMFRVQSHLYDKLVS
jgi:hypothetical protein